jgi:hypothetical protein
MRRLAKGEGKLGCIFWLLLLTALGLGLYRFVPNKIAVAELKDYMEDVGMHEGRATPEQLKKLIMQRASQLKLPLEEKNLRIEKTGDRVIMNAEMTIVIDLFVTKRPWVARISVDKPVFIGG